MNHALAVGSLLTVLLAATPARSAPVSEPVSEPAPEAEPQAPQAPDDESGRAPALVSWKRSLCIYTGCFLEPFIPDVRYQWGQGSREHWVLSWPIHPWAFPAWDIPGPTLILSPFVEPQVRLAPAAYRLLAGARVYAFPDSARLGVLAEGAGLWGQDGSGGLAGLGLTYDLIERGPNTKPWTVSVVLRRAWTGEGTRMDLSLDVTVPLNMFLGSPLDSRGPGGRSSANRHGNPRLGPGGASSLFPGSTPRNMEPS
ncbi:hypothetical protein [Myxococcus eversor]|uniref:hypothetical protein n=1 Tax=Myxococcus eversor TaxID=2709661 RepID=UPI001F07BE85|nr:hypothetical protein [Myxococcus eversor]